jgi:hypothetical protein
VLIWKEVQAHRARNEQAHFERQLSALFSSPPQQPPAEGIAAVAADPQPEEEINGGKSKN